MLYTRISILIAVLALLLYPVTTAVAQEEPESPPEEDAPAEEEFVPTYTLGDQTLAINMGLFIPLFFAGGPDGIANANLSL
ncbi:MAG: hypothetical protein GVY23_08515, partial [Spirochaetes bacterium]|nr:hypothetical protein [Spirochaetota bacterium]